MPGLQKIVEISARRCHDPHDAKPPPKTEAGNLELEAGNLSAPCGLCHHLMTISSQAPLVLVVEDYADAREMYAAYMALFGFRVLEAIDGLEAVRIAADSRPDAIVMDLALPGIDGCEATRRLKADARTARIPVIALSGHVLPRQADEARSAGCAAVLLKPCAPDALVAEVRRILSTGARD